MNIPHDRLLSLTAAIFRAAGCAADEASRVATRLVEANLVGHDSHGVIRIPSYVAWLLEGKVFAGRSIEVVFENEVVAVVDGRFGLGQTIGEQAMQLAIDKSARHGVSVVALRNSGHLGRIGDWAEMAVRAGRISLHFVNTSGAGMLVAPHGGIDRRLSANPIAAGVPTGRGDPLILDMSACTIAEGKIRVALNSGRPLPEGCVIDFHGRPTNDPRVFYADPPGAILPISGHKGSGLAAGMSPRSFATSTSPSVPRTAMPIAAAQRRPAKSSIIASAPRWFSAHVSTPDSPGPRSMQRHEEKSARDPRFVAKGSLRAP